VRGTEKQIRWAESIQAQHAKGLRRMVAVLGRIPEEIRADYEARILAPARELGERCGDLAGRWIDARQSLTVALGACPEGQFAPMLGRVLGGKLEKTPLGRWFLLREAGELDIPRPPKEVRMNLTGDPALGRIPVGWDPACLGEAPAARVLDRATSAWEVAATEVVLPDQVAKEVRAEVEARGIRVIRESDAR